MQLFLILVFGYYLMKNYLIPPIWLYRNIFSSLGLRLLSLTSLLIIKYTSLYGQSEYEFIFNFLILILVFLVVFQLYNTELKQKTPLQLKPSEIEIMSDRAQIIANGDKLEIGRAHV